MKNIFIGILLLQSITQFAQVPADLYYFDANAIAVKMVYNGKNEIIARQEYRARDSKSANGLHAVSGQTVTIKEGKQKDITIGWFSANTGIVRTDIYKGGSLYERRLLTEIRKM